LRTSLFNGSRRTYADDKRWKREFPVIEPETALGIDLENLADNEDWA
jgi:hypothetical protein